MSCADYFLPPIHNTFLTPDVIKLSIVVILWHNVAEITYKYIAKLDMTCIFIYYDLKITIQLLVFKLPTVWNLKQLY